MVLVSRFFHNNGRLYGFISAPIIAEVQPWQSIRHKININNKTEIIFFLDIGTLFDRFNYTKLKKNFIKIKNMAIPQDPNILVSMLNMKLRDGDYESLDELFDLLGFDKEETLSLLRNAGFSFVESVKQFR